MTEEVCEFDVFMKVVAFGQKGRVGMLVRSDVNSLQCRFKQSRRPKTKNTLYNCNL